MTTENSSSPNPEWGNDLPDPTDTSMTTHLALLKARGLVVPAPESLSDAAVPVELARLVHHLAENRVFLINTDHLTDRELYAKLVAEALLDPVFPSGDPTHYDVIDLVGNQSEEDMRLYHRYYADEDERDEWQSSYPEYIMPPQETPPYQRDIHLPKSPEMSDFDE